MKEDIIILALKGWQPVSYTNYDYMIYNHNLNRDLIFRSNFDSGNKFFRVSLSDRQDLGYRSISWDSIPAEYMKEFIRLAQDE
jgi:hypothetical protein